MLGAIKVNISENVQTQNIVHPEIGGFTVETSNGESSVFVDISEAEWAVTQNEEGTVSIECAIRRCDFHDPFNSFKTLKNFDFKEVLNYQIVSIDYNIICNGIDGPPKIKLESLGAYCDKEVIEYSKDKIDRYNKEYKGEDYTLLMTSISY